MPKRLWNALEDGWKISHKRSDEEGVMRNVVLALFGQVKKKLGLERKLVMLSATGLSPSGVRDSTASPRNTTLILLSHNPVFTV